MSIRTEKLTITPKMASDILEEHYRRVADGKFRQRKIYTGTVNRYICDMKSGSWKLNPNPIVFDTDDNLANGQHRLEAVRKSGVSIEAYVSYGWPPEVIDVEDIGKNRSVSDQLHLHGKQNSILFTASINSIIRIALRGNRGLRGGSTYSSVTYVMNELDMERHVDSIMSIISGQKRTGRCIGPLAYYRSCNAKKADLFAHKLADMDLEKGTGPSLYVKHMTNNAINDQDIAIRAICSCLKLWDEDETAEYIKPSFSSVEWLGNQNKKLQKAILYLFPVFQQEETK